MSYVLTWSGSSECDPGWVQWAEHETVTRLRDQLTELRVTRELRRAVEQGETEVETAAPEESLSPEPVVRHSVSAMNAPPNPRDPAWQVWAEAQTVLRLRREREMKAPPAPPPSPEPELVLQSESTEAARPAETQSELRLEVPPRRTIRIHHDNLRSVGV